MADPPLSRNLIRLLALALAVALLAAPAVALVTHAVGTGSGADSKRVESVSGPDRPGYTAITTQQFEATYPDAELVLIAPNGSTAYTNTRWDSYFDVDPVPGTEATVEYVASEDLSDEDCNNGDTCTREVLIRENFSTGESAVRWSRVTPSKHNTRVHDIDRINGTHIAVADIYDDTVFVYDTEREIRVWSWNAQRDFPIDGGGPFPEDWTHVNDVEVLSDGRLMVSLRNQDSVVFLTPDGRLQSDWTLGSDDDYDVLYEQHNPDFIQGETPTVLVANSEQNVINEFERSDGEWVATWTWRDGRMQWPRDADRLPNGHTLITDTQGGRVIEIDDAGDVVWTAEIGLPYEAERLSTGAESTGGRPASDVGIPSQGGSTAPSDEGDTQGGLVAGAKDAVRSVVPSKLLNGILFILPPWMMWWHLPLLLLAVVDLLVWGVLEFRWSDYELRRPVHRSGR